MGRLRLETNGSNMPAKTRCPWVNPNNKLDVHYHDNEWGRPIHDDRQHFEMITLEGAQAGLSWSTILNKREGYREAFCNFDPEVVATFTKRDINRLLKDPSIVRNRLKVESTVSNAKAFLKIQEEFGSFDDYIWSFVEYKPIQTTFKKIGDYLATSPISDLISKDLKKRGFRFVGSTIIYAYMQACGMTNDHSKDCYLHGRKFRGATKK